MYYAAKITSTYL